MSTVYEIPITPSTPQSFTVSLNGGTYNISLNWNSSAQCWIMDIGDQSNNPLVQGIPLITGADLLAQLEYIGIGGNMIVQTDNDPTAVPTFDSLGDTGHLFYNAP